MSQSPETEARRPRYEDGWEAINRMIREDGSWSGRERNCFHVSCPDGTFADVSAASGIDFIEDGRAFAIIDLERDGDPDILLRSRNGSRLRVLRNDFQPGGGTAAAWIEVEGPRGGESRTTRDAAGARVEIDCERGRRLKEVEAGSGFLSQSSPALCFGLGSLGAARSARVRWPDGSVEELGPIAPGRRYRVSRGLGMTSEAFRPDPATGEAAGAPPAPELEVPLDSPAAATWLLEPLPPPDPRLTDLDGRARSLADHRGRPLLVLFASIDCGSCDAELRALPGELEAIRAAGGAALAVAVDGPERLEAMRAWFREREFPAPVLVADPDALAAWGVLHRQLWSRPRRLAVPLAFLLGPDGRIEKAYRGRRPPGEFLADLRKLPLDSGDRLALALPFPGRLLGPPFRRDLFLLGAGFIEAGLPRQAAAALEEARRGRPGDAEVDYNLGIAYARAGDEEKAAAAYRRALESQPRLVDALNNLGVLDARAGRLAAARRSFEDVLARQPQHTEAILNLAQTHLQEEDAPAAAAVLERALEDDPGSAPLWRLLGRVRVKRQEIDAATEAFRSAYRLEPADPDSASGLSALLAIRQDDRAALEEARRIAGEALRHHPDHPALLGALGQALSRLGDLAGAEAALRRLLEIRPENPAARALLDEIRRSPQK